MISWELNGLEREGEPQEPPSFGIKPETHLLIVPTFVNNNHWMLCVANLPDAEDSEGTLNWYILSNRADYQ